jgi:hypothetical protein
MRTEGNTRLKMRWKFLQAKSREFWVKNSPPLGHQLMLRGSLDMPKQNLNHMMSITLMVQAFNIIIHRYWIMPKSIARSPKRLPKTKPH